MAWQYGLTEFETQPKAYLASKQEGIKEKGQTYPVTLSSA